MREHERTGMNTPAQPFLPFALPDIGEDEIAEVVDTLRGGWITTGRKVQRFELSFAEFLIDPSLHCIAVNSATSGLHLSLEALGIGPGDEVITTTHTFTATAEVVRHLGADVRLVDINPQTLNIDPQAVEMAITPRTKAILPVHYAGLAADMKALHAIAHRHDLQVVEDAAHALPTTLNGRLVGTLPSASTVFSFYANKTITTGEGGMIVTANANLARRARMMLQHGMDRNAFERFTATMPSWHYEIIAPGYKYNLTDIAASLGLHQLRRAHAMAEQRAAIASRYEEAFADLPLLRPPKALPGDLHAWHLYVIRLTDDAPIGRDSFIKALFQKGIGCSVHYIPLHQHPYWRDRYALSSAQFPNSQDAFERMVSLPLFTRMSDADVERVIQTVRQVLQS